MTAHFVDIDCLMELGGKAWIVDKSEPNVPIIKVSRHEFNLYKSGIYRSQGNKVEFNGVEFWLPSDVYGRLKVKLKNSTARLGNLAVSMQEFLNRELVENLPYSVDLRMLARLKNKVDDIYLVCSRQTERSYGKHIARLKEDMSEQGITVKGHYHLSDSFHNNTDDRLVFRRARLFVQHLVGYRTEGTKFVDNEVARYDRIYAYDSNKSLMMLKEELNPVLRTIINNTPDNLARVVKGVVDEFRPTIELVLLTGNEVNREIRERVHLDHSTLIRHFESFSSARQSGLFFR
jgi:hypothetical protein